MLPEYLWVYLSSTAAQEEMTRRALPGTVPSLDAVLGNVPVLVPPLDRQRVPIAAVVDIEELASIHRDTADRLDALTTTLLDDLLGEV